MFTAHPYDAAGDELESALAGLEKAEGTMERIGIHMASAALVGAARNVSPRP